MNKTIKLIFFLFFVLFFLFSPFLVKTSLAAFSGMLNPSFEEVDPANPAKAANWTDFGNGNGYTISSTIAKSGQKSLVLKGQSLTTYTGAYQRIDLNQETKKPVFLGGYVRGSNIKMQSGSWLGASLYAEIYLKDGSVVYWNSVPNKGTFDWRWIGFNTGTISSVNGPISHIFVIPVLGYSTGTAYFDDIKVTENTPAQSAVTIMFDDGEISTYTKAFPVLSSSAYPASAAIIVNEIGQSGFMTKAQLLSLQQNGWEIVSHTLTHDDLTTMSLSRIKRELVSSKNRLTNMGFSVKNFAMPFGAYNAQILGEAQKIYRSARAYEQGTNVQGAFPYDVKVRGILNTTTPEEVGALIESAKVNNEWVVLVFHKIESTGDDQYFITEEGFEGIVNKIKETGVNVITYDQGISLFGSTQ